jgi:adenine-specific DNA-methyltransferase
LPILNWLTRDEDIQATKKVPYRLLEEVPELSYGDKESGNMLIQGDNLEALKALLPFYAGQVKCIYIDPPYNTKSAFEKYDDNLEHSKWLATIFPRLELLRELLTEDGSIWVSIDDNEAHYLKVIMDEVFGRKNFIANVVWQKRTSPDARLRLGAAHDHIIVYAKHSQKVSFNKIPLSEDKAKNFKNPDDDDKGPWASTDFTGQTGHATPNQFYTIISPSGKSHPPPNGRCWALNENSFYKLVEEGRVWFGKNGDARPRLKRYLAEVDGISSWTWWSNVEVGHNQESKKEILNIFGGDVFDTPKPERLIQRVMHISSNQNDLVLDSFLGSGTTLAVAQKMNRRYIGIELGDHAVTHCQPRMQKVVDGEQGGISEAQSWKGGGGFRFYRLGANAFDEDGRICSDIRFPVLAAHVWFSETNSPWNGAGDNPALGIHDGNGFALLYNGILGDKRPGGGNVLTGRTLQIIRDNIARLEKEFAGPLIIYGESSRMGGARLKRENVIFKQTPYDVKAR